MFAPCFPCMLPEVPCPTFRGNDSPQPGPACPAQHPHNTGPPGRVPWKGPSRWAGWAHTEQQPAPLGGTFAGANETGPWPSHRTQPQTATSSKPPGFHNMAPSSEGIAIPFVPPGRPTHVRIAGRVCAALYCEGPTQARTHLKFCCTSPLHGGHSLFLPPCN